MTAFRAVYADFHELRTLVPSVRMTALTATATDFFRLTNIREVTENPNKAKITYVVNYMPNESDVQDYFDWIV